MIVMWHVYCLVVIKEGRWFTPCYLYNNICYYIEYQSNFMFKIFFCILKKRYKRILIEVLINVSNAIIFLFSQNLSLDYKFCFSSKQVVGKKDEKK